MVSEATVPLSDQSYYLPKSAFGRGEGREVGGQREREGAILIISKSSYPQNEGVATNTGTLEEPLLIPGRKKPGQSKETQQPLAPMPVLEAVLIPRDE